MGNKGGLSLPHQHSLAQNHTVLYTIGPAKATTNRSQPRRDTRHLRHIAAHMARYATAKTDSNARHLFMIRNGFKEHRQQRPCAVHR